MRTPTNKVLLVQERREGRVVVRKDYPMSFLVSEYGLTPSEAHRLVEDTVTWWSEHLSNVNGYGLSEYKQNVSIAGFVNGYAIGVRANRH